MTRIMPRAAVIAGAGILAAALAATVPAGAQSLPDPRRLPSLFGPGSSDGRQQLDLTVTALAANADDIVLQDVESGLSGLSPHGSGTYESASVQLGYVRRFRSSTFSANGRSVAQHFQGLGNPVGFQRALSVGYDVHRRGTRIAVGQSVNQFPLFALQPVPSLFNADVAELAPPVADDAVASVSARRYITSADMTQMLGGRASLAASLRIVNTSLDGGAATLRQDIASAHLTYHLTRDLGLVTGYGVQRGSYRFPIGTTDRTDIQNIDLGLSYNRALSFSRRTSVTMSSGPVLVRNPVTRTTEYTLGGEARINHQMRRSWQATAAYTRGVTFMDGFGSPFLGDTIAANIGGNLRRRVELTLGGGFWRGTVVGAPGDQTGAPSDRSESVNGTSRLTIVLSQTTALTGEYRYVHYQLSALPLFAGVPLWIDRGSVRVSIDLRIPFIH